MAGIAPIRIIAFLLLGACVALCQQREEDSTVNSLPDAPSLRASAHTETFRVLAAEARSPVAPRWGGAGPAVVADSEPANGHRPAEVLYGDFYREAPVQQDSGDFFQKHLYPTLLKRSVSYHPSSSSNLMGRATDAASRIFIVPEDSGKTRLNTSYLLGTLASAAAHSAYRPYWRRSISEPLSDFGSKIGNDAGMNLFHEFGPGIRQLMKSHEPKFVSRMEEHIHHN
jgi:hypothetical protein